LARQACAGANEEELTTCAKFWGHEVGGKGNTIKGDPHKSSRRPLVAPNRATADQSETTACSRQQPAITRWLQAAAYIDRRDDFFLTYFWIPFLFFILGPLHVARP
jgi:hypothetical protein